MLGIRILVALIGIPILLGASFLGGWWLTLLVSGIAYLGLLEFYRLAARMDLKPLTAAGVLGGVLLIITAYTAMDMISRLAVLFTVGLLFIYLFYFPRLGLADIAVTLLGIWYLGGLLAHLLMIRFLPDGGRALIMTFLFTWVYDTGAYFCGCLFGRQHPWPQISPRKTVAGVIGGFIGILILIVTLGPLFLPLRLDFWMVLFLAVIVVAAAQMGDLVGSALKRQAGVKNSGWLLPGHGGILDRFDSLLLVAPVIYYYLAFCLA